MYIVSGNGLLHISSTDNTGTNFFNHVESAPHSFLSLGISHEWCEYYNF